MADHNVWIVSFCKVHNSMIGLERLQNYYSVGTDSVFLFQYFGKSTFYVSILASNGVDILNPINQKLLLKDVVVEDTVEQITLPSSSLDTYEGINCITFSVNI